MLNDLNQDNEAQINQILEELEELELLTKGMHDPGCLQELAIRKTKHLLNSYQELCKASIGEKKEEDTKVEEYKSEVLHTKEQTVEIQQPEEKKEVPVADIAKSSIPVETEKETAPETPVCPPMESVAEPVKEESEKDELSNNPAQSTIRKELNVVTKNDQFKSKSVDLPISNVKRVEEKFIKKDLRTAFNLNDRIRYTNNLFGGKREEMTATIENLNNLNNYEEALSYLSANFRWDLEDETTNEFLEIIKKRFL